MRSLRTVLPLAALILIHPNLHAANHVQQVRQETQQHHLVATRVAYHHEFALHHPALPATTVDRITHPTVLTYVYNLIHGFLGL